MGVWLGCGADRAMLFEWSYWRKNRLRELIQWEHAELGGADQCFGGS